VFPLVPKTAKNRRGGKEKMMDKDRASSLNCDFLGGWGGGCGVGGGEGSPFFKLCKQDISPALSLEKKICVRKLSRKIVTVKKGKAGCKTLPNGTSIRLRRKGFFSKKKNRRMEQLYACKGPK